MTSSHSEGHVMSAERLSDDYMYSLAASKPPPPPPPPGPTPPMPPAPAGFKAVGAGSCRDAHGLEPGYWTNENRPGAGAAVTLEECEAACAGSTGDCGGVAYCNDEGAGVGCQGECHLYMAQSSLPPSASKWHYYDGDGHLPIVQVTKEWWWYCYSRGSSTFSDKTLASVGVDRAPLQPASLKALAVVNSERALPVGTMPPFRGRSKTPLSNRESAREH